MGFMGSGKSTVGSLLASRLGWSFVDLDDEIERRAGAPVEEIFREKGEGFFRALEAEAGREVLRMERVVVATGGGWPAAAGRIESLDAQTLSVWLAVNAPTSIERVRRGGRVRPLLAVPDALGRAERLLTEREAFYERAELHLDACGSTPEQLAETILQHMEAASRTAGR